MAENIAMTEAEMDYVLGRFFESSPKVQRGVVATLLEDREILAVALRELVSLQSHYAKLLNGYDGGERFAFPSAQQWIDRLHKLGKIPRSVSV